MSAVPKFVTSYTIDDYQSWEGDWELWDGIAVSMSPSPFGMHQRVLVRLAAALELQIQQIKCDAETMCEIDWMIAQHTVVRPDLVVVCDGVPEQHVTSPPSMIAEILSPSTAQRDQTHKRDLYEEQCVSTYLIIDPKQQSVTQYNLQANGKYKMIPKADELVLKLCDHCQVKLECKALFPTNKSQRPQ